MAELHDRESIEATDEPSESWQMNAYAEFARMIAARENEFPCLPGRQSFLLNHLRYGFLGDPRESETAQALAELLSSYGKRSRHTGKYASLVVFFETPSDMVNDYKVENFRTLFWNLLNEAADQDRADWPEAMPANPEDPAWEFCFAGEPYFVFCATPAHKMRRSRYFPTFMMTFQPRWVFEDINDSTSYGRKIKQLIRQRLISYDACPPHPDLKWYGQSDNHEWKQYFLDDNETPVNAACPFHYKKSKDSSTAAHGKFKSEK